MTRSWIGLAGLGALLVVGVTLIAVEISKGALDYGTETVAAPCADHPAFPGEGLDATIQRIVLDGLDGAACKLGVTREELVLSLDKRSGVTIDWDKKAVEDAVRAGLIKAVQEADDRGTIPGLLVPIIEKAIEKAPISVLIEGGSKLLDLFQ